MPSKTESSFSSDTERSHAKEYSKTSARSQVSPGWFASLRAMLPFGVGPGTPTTRLFEGIPGYPRILLIGLDAAGKSLLMEKFLVKPGKEGELHVANPRIGVWIEMVRAETATFYAYDIGGCRPGSYRLFDRALFRGAEAVVYVWKLERSS